MENFPKYLLAGYTDFKNNGYEKQAEKYHELADDGQKPETLIISCCDSRATPEAIFNTKVGELFVVRNVANLVPIYAPDEGQHGTSAAIEFAILALKVKNIVVMGHGRCGGIQAALTKDFAPLEKGDFISKWIDMIKPLAKKVLLETDKSATERQTSLEHKSVINSLENLRTFPYIKELEAAGKLNLYGAWFDIKFGDLKILDKNGDFTAA
ncbi:MAG: carbonic anhydrase [Devosiaceae bacterium]|nr:carbonic anhydrase [Devosiaceae bacterium]